MRGVFLPSEFSTAKDLSSLVVDTSGGGRWTEGDKACLDATAFFASWRLPLDSWAAESALKSGAVAGGVMCSEFDTITLSPLDGFGDELGRC